MKRLPQKVNIRGVEYPVKLVKWIDPKRVIGGEAGDIVYAAFDRMHTQIEIRKDLSTARKHIYFIHECLHGLTEDFDFDEEEIDELAWRLLDFLARNRLRFD